MYDLRPNTIIGFHGCDLAILNKLVANPNQIEISKKLYDWLGHGMYFWENNYSRAMEWANNKANKGEITNPAVPGAVIQLGYCCDFLDSKFTSMIGHYYELMSEVYTKSGKPMPKNVDSKEDGNKDKAVRLLDCATIEYMHSEIENRIRAKYPPVNSGRSQFLILPEELFLKGVLHFLVLVFTVPYL